MFERLRRPTDAPSIIPFWPSLVRLTYDRSTVSQRSPSTGTLELGTGRVEAFSDAVMAVIITIMAFSLRPPHGATWTAVRAQMPGLLVYMLSFVFIAIYWNNHHHLLRAADRISGAAMWANMFLLFWLSLIPVVTVWIRDEYRHSLPAAAYGIVALAAALAYTLLVRTLLRANGRPKLDGSETPGTRPAQPGAQFSLPPGPSSEEL